MNVPGLSLKQNCYGAFAASRIKAADDKTSVVPRTFFKWGFIPTPGWVGAVVLQTLPFPEEESSHLMCCLLGLSLHP